MPEIASKKLLIDLKIFAITTVYRYLQNEYLRLSYLIFLDTFFWKNMTFTQYKKEIHLFQENYDLNKANYLSNCKKLMISHYPQKILDCHEK